MISGNNNDGVAITYSSSIGNQIQGNFLGTDVTGTLDIGNISSGAVNNIVGETTFETRYLISGNGNIGVYIGDVGSNNNVIKGNYTGTDVTGTRKLIWDKC